VFRSVLERSHNAQYLVAADAVADAVADVVAAGVPPGVPTVVAGPAGAQAVVESSRATPIPARPVNAGLRASGFPLTRSIPLVVLRCMAVPLLVLVVH
jgi:hypothetical protein